MVCLCSSHLLNLWPEFWPVTMSIGCSFAVTMRQRSGLSNWGQMFSWSCSYWTTREVGMSKTTSLESYKPLLVPGKAQFLLNVLAPSNCTCMIVHVHIQREMQESIVPCTVSSPSHLRLLITHLTGFSIMWDELYRVNDRILSLCVG